MTRSATKDNNPSGSLARYTFPKKERLCKKRGFDLLFTEGSSFNKGRLRVNYMFDPPEEIVTAPVMAAFVAPKRAFRRAHDRNRIKRLMREAYRLNKSSLISLISGESRSLIFLVKFNGHSLPEYNSLGRDIRRVIDKLKELACSSSEA